MNRENSKYTARIFHAAGAALAALAVLAGCATPASDGAGCYPGSSAAACGNAAPPAPVAAATPPQQQERFVRLQAALDAETQAAREAQASAVAATQKLPVAMRLRAGEVSQTAVTITDSQSGQQAQVRALDAVEVWVPLAGRSRKESKAALDALRALGHSMANNRGSATIVVEQSAKDVKARRSSTATGVTQTAEGKPVKLEKTVSNTLQPGLERYVIRAGAIRGQL
ncbi:MAG: hypothetical protein EOO33_02365 [Comamonadaceae bacterium]|nr:MAG: hypothetical protein EOO33_02365 [Comamonadaceae bacterium]